MFAVRRARLDTTFTLLIAWNVGAWLLTLWSWHGQPALLAAALLAYTFGLRHAVDPDHIAAIDNATRRLIGIAARPHLTGLYFSLGHSSVVVVLCILVASGAEQLARNSDLARIGAIVGPVFSIAFLVFFAFLNLVALRGLFRARAGGTSVDHDGASDLPASRSLLAWLCRRLFRVVTRPADLFWIGMLFGLGFDTATEIGLLGLAAANGRHGGSAWAMLLLPFLFAAGMALLDTADSAFMSRAYGWARRDAARKIDYNIAVTLASVVIALAVSAAEGFGFLSGHVDHDTLLGVLASISGDYGMGIGIGIVGLFAGIWGVFVVRRPRRLLAD
jgi:high-affinity nickel-transport protein